MLSIRPYQCCTNSAVNNRMKPPRQIKSTWCCSSADCKTTSNAARSLPNGLLSMATAGIPLAFAVSRPPASERLEITTTIWAGKSSAAAAWIIAAMFDPRPEIRIATRRFMSSPCRIDLTMRDRDDRYKPRDVLAALREDVGDLFDGIRLHDRDHADAAVEGAQQFEFGDAPLLCQPLENRQHRHTRKVDPDAEMLGQHARNIIGETAAGDMGKTLDRIGLADRAQA